MKKNHGLILFNLLLLLLLPTLINATIASNVSQPNNIGNFALPSSQTPGPFFSFGQNIMDKNQAQLYFEPNYFKATNQYYLEYDTSLLYGLTDTASLLLTLPIAIDYMSYPYHSSGYSDVSGQLEYAFYESGNANYTEQATIVAGLSLPTGSYKKTPPTGFGSSTIFIGSTYNRTFIDWLWFTSPGVLLVTPQHNIHQGSQYFYQFGVGKNVLTFKNKYIVLGLLEFDGQYTEKDNVSGHEDPNTGGNVVFITPSIWLSTPRLIFQLGISLPMVQKWYGNQGVDDYYVAASLGCTINS